MNVDICFKVPSVSPPATISMLSSCSRLTCIIFSDFVSFKMPRAARKWTLDEDDLLRQEVNAQCE